MLSRRGFTLIELLIVIAIILILIAIALPNFLSAQVRAKITRNYADMRSVATALEAYRGDYQQYISGVINKTPGNFKSYLQRLVPLTTPVKYMSIVPDDIFNGNGEQPPYNEFRTFDYFLYDDLAQGALIEFYDIQGRMIRAPYQMRGWGPDRDNDRFSGARLSPPQGPIPYNPTNGTDSNGDLKYFGGRGYQF